MIATLLFGSSLRSRLATCFSLLFLFAAACSKPQTGEAFESDANGYVCLKCDEKFYTDRSVAAEICPKCKSTELSEVMGFACPDDNTVVLIPRGLNAVPCPKCRQFISQLKLPQASELEAWGATRHEKAAVLLKP